MPSPEVRVKICGITGVRDASMAVEAGADALGFIFWKNSPRAVGADAVREIIKKGLPPFITTVGVFVNEAEDVVNNTVRRCGLDRVQLHGDETPEYCGKMDVRVIKALRVRLEADIEAMRRYDVSAFLLDTYKEGLPGGTGATFDWDIAVKAKRFGNVILSGGLTPENVKEAVLRVGPFAVDVSSGVESSPGKKDEDRVRSFIRNARGAR